MTGPDGGLTPPSPKVSVIIPSADGDRGGNLRKLLRDLLAQSFRDWEVVVARGAAPNGHARNVAVRRAGGKILVLLDDDLRLGDAAVLENLVRTTEEHPECGMVGSSQRIPPDANRFQRESARQLPRSEFPIVERCTETDMVNHCAGFAIRAALYQSVGGESDTLWRGTDPDLRHRVRQAGYRVVVAPRTYSYHPLPDRWGEFWRYHWRSGGGTARVFRLLLARRSEEGARVVDVVHGPDPLAVPHRPVWWRAIRFLGRMAGAAVRARWILLASYAAYAGGFACGLIAPWKEAPSDGEVMVYDRDALEHLLDREEG